MNRIFNLKTEVIYKNVSLSWDTANKSYIKLKELNVATPLISRDLEIHFYQVLIYKLISDKKEHKRTKSPEEDFKVYDIFKQYN